MATLNDLRVLLTEMFGDLGPAINPQGAVVPGAPPNPSLIEKLSSMKKKADVSKPPGPDIFCGSTQENARLWKTKMNDYLTHCGYTSHQERMRVIKMFLSDCALIWYEGLTPVQKANTTNFWAQFEKQYTAADTQHAKVQALVDRKQLPTEDAESFKADVLKKAHMVGWDDDRTMQHLVSGLNSRLKPFVLMRNPTTLGETCRAIDMAEEATKAQVSDLAGVQTALKDLAVQLKTEKEEKKVAAVQQQPAPTYDQNQGQNRSYGGNYNRGSGRRFGRGFGRGRGASRPVVPIVIHTSASNPGNQGRPNNRFQNSNQGKGNVCWTCGSPQHFANQCPQSSQIVCYGCNNTGHIKRNCPNSNRFQRRSGGGGGRGRGRGRGGGATQNNQQEN